MHDESTDLMKSLMHTLGVITVCTVAERKRIAEAYEAAQALVTGIASENGSARPRIVACFERIDVYKATDDVAAAGWILTALQERIAERNLAGWQALKIVADKAAALLRPSRMQMH